MRKLWRNALIGSALLLAAAAANAQVYRDDPYWRSDRGDYRRDPGYGRGPFAEIDRVQADLSRAMSLGYLSHGQRRTLEKAQGDLYDLQRQWSRGHYSNHELDEAIGRIQNVVDHGRLSYRDRDVLQEDANRLRDLRASGAYRSAPYGYR